MKKTISLILAVIMMMAVVPIAYATEPTNGATYTNSYVFGGLSQTILIKTCTCTNHCNYEITALNLCGQSRISFRPYIHIGDDDFIACSSPSNITNTTSVIPIIYNENTSSINTGTTMKMRASIPSTNYNNYAIFSGWIKF